MNYYLKYIKYKLKYFNLKYTNIGNDELKKNIFFEDQYIDILNDIFNIFKNFSDMKPLIFGGSSIKYHLINLNLINEQRYITNDIDMTIIVNDRNDNDNEYYFELFYDKFYELYDSFFNIKYIKNNDNLFIIYINEFQIIDVTIYNIFKNKNKLLNDDPISMRNYAINQLYDFKFEYEFYLNKFNEIEENYTNLINIMSDILFEYFSIVKGIDNLIFYFSQIKIKKELLKQFDHDSDNHDDLLYRIALKETSDDFINKKKIKLKKYIFKLFLIKIILKSKEINSMYNDKYESLDFYKEKIDDLNIITFITELFE